MYHSRRHLCEITWVKDAQKLGIDVVFVTGSTLVQVPERTGNQLVVPSPDNYESLPQKVREMFRWALSETDFDWLFKCDDDTYIRCDRLLAVDVRGRDYIGGEWSPGVGYASGGAGYLLNRRATQIVVQQLSNSTGPEDLLVGQSLRDAGIPLSIDSRFIAFGDDNLRPLPGNSLITTHACRQPWLMHPTEFENKPPTVTCATASRLGNTMFRIAAAIGYSRKHGTHRAVFDEGSLGIYRSTVFHRLEIGEATAPASYADDAADFSFQPIPFDPRVSVSVSGYLQSEKYFEHCREEIRALFRPSPDDQLQLEQKYADRLGPATISLHVRRGSYVSKQEYHPLQTIAYYQRAIDHIERQTAVSHILCFSDDPDWCRDNLTFDARLELITNLPDHLDMALMSMCRHHIIANSTFSWWGAWLNPHPRKIVVAPVRWFGPSYAYLTDRDLIPDGWIRLDGNSP